MPGTRLLDPLFLLSRYPTSAAVLGDVPGMAAALNEAGIAEQPDAELVVAPASRWAEVARSRARLALVHGAPLCARRGGWTSQRVLALPRPRAARLLLPLGDPAAARGALARNAPRWTRRATVKDEVAQRLLGAGMAPPARQLLVGSRDGVLPWPLAVAAESGLDVRGSRWLVLGDGDVLQRAALHVVNAYGGLVVKLGRVPASKASFERDRSASALTARLPPAVARAVPALLLSTEAHGLPLAVEQRVDGRPLLELLASRLPAADKLAEVERVADWVHALGAATARPAAALGPERERLAREVLPRWTEFGAPVAAVEAALSALPDLPAVLQHNDLGAWNVVADGRGGFGVVDWESARSAGLPLWDLVYFLGDALTSFSGAPPAERVHELVRLFAGDHARSAVLFSHLRRAVGAASVPADAVGAIVTLCWLHHGLSPADRRARHGDAGTGTVALASLVAERWLQEPQLGPGWCAWR